MGFSPQNYQDHCGTSLPLYMKGILGQSCQSVYGSTPYNYFCSWQNYDEGPLKVLHLRSSCHEAMRHPKVSVTIRQTDTHNFDEGSPKIGIRVPLVIRACGTLKVSTIIR